MLRVPYGHCTPLRAAYPLARDIPCDIMQHMMKYLVGLIVIVALVVGGYYLYMNYSGTPVDNANQETPTDQVQAQDVTVGTGALAEPGSIVSVLYVGRLEDGTVFDSSEAHGNEPLVFQLGAPGIIPGFQTGGDGMREGGAR